jgi:WD40 repeat protein
MKIAIVMFAVASALLLAPSPGNGAAPPAGWPRTDIHGDRLPAGALARIGTARFCAAQLGWITFVEGGKVLVCGPPKGLLAWDAGTGQALDPGPWEKTVRKEFLLRADLMKKRGGRAPADSPDGKMRAEVDQISKVVTLTDRATEKVIHRWHCERSMFTDLAFSPDSKRLAASMLHKVVVWEVPSGKEIVPVGEHHEESCVMALSPDGKILFTGSQPATLRATGPAKPSAPDVAIRRWDTATGMRLPASSARPAHFPPPLLLSPTGKRLVSEDSRGALTLWDADSGKLVRKLPRELSDSYGAFSADGKRFVSWSAGGTGWNKPGTLWLWDATTGRELGRLDGHRDMVWAAGFSPDGRQLASWGLRDETLRLWDVTSGRELRQLKGKDRGLTRLAFSRDGCLLAASGRHRTVFQVWEVASGCPLDTCDVQHVLKVQRHSDYGILFGADGRSLVLTDVHGKIYCWDLATGRLRRHWQADSRIYQLALSADGRILASQGNSAVLIWDLAGASRGSAAGPAPGEKDLATLWADLAASDAGKAYRAVWRLADFPDVAVPFLSGRLRPAAGEDGVSAKQLAQLIADLDADSFKLREEATRRLEALGKQAETALRRALAGSPSPEMRRRAERVLNKLAGADVPAPPPEQLRGLRVIAALEQVGTRAAQKVLERLATGAEKAALTREAKASLRRLATRGLASSR